MRNCISFNQHILSIDAIARRILNLLWQTLATVLPGRTVGILENNCHGPAKANCGGILSYRLGNDEQFRFDLESERSDDTARVCL